MRTSFVIAKHYSIQAARSVPRFQALLICAAWIATPLAARAQAPIAVGTLGVRLEKVVEGLNGELVGNTANVRTQMIPIDMAPIGDGRQLVLTLTGHVRLLQSDGTLAAGAYLDTFNSNSPPPIPTSGGEITDFRQIGNTSIAVHPGFLRALEPWVWQVLRVDQ